ncbi:MAG: phosphoribosylaminoimidazolesuccinocarboxamide synthase [Myxococcales bacterium]|nr:phosphoribosylaminoimidazolesuccinocarboxamide synthase [Myxococcales bacterium]
MRDQLVQRLTDGFTETDPSRLTDCGELIRGKVRDVYVSENELFMVTTDRLSAFDVVLTSVPCKGAILNAIAVEAFRATEDLCPNHLIEVPHPNVMRVKRTQPLPIEIILRRYITGSLWRDLHSGKAAAYEIDFPEGLKRDQRFDEVICTPSTKAEVGLHDEPISERAIVEEGLVSQALLDEVIAKARALFQRGEELAAARGLILVDTKYEFGLTPEGELIVIDEIHTADSSRYWVADEYQARFEAGEAQRMLDKENIRQWLIGQCYQGEGEPPHIPDEVRLDLAETYAELHDRLLGRPFEIPAGSPQDSLYS